MKLLFVFSILCCLNAIATAQNNMIRWQKGQKIQWDNFEGEIDLGSSFSAFTTATLHFKTTFSMTGSAITPGFEIYAAFDKSRSWSKKEQQTEELLEHEQLHFDIAQMFALKARKELERNHYSLIEIMEIMKKMNAELAAMQKKYDRQTSHSLDRKKQKEWEKHIKEELDKLIISEDDDFI